MKRIFLLHVCCLFVSAQSKAEGFVLTETELARGLGVSKPELELESKQLAGYLQGQTKLAQACEKNPAPSPNLCKLVIALELTKDSDQKAEQSGAKELFMSAPSRITNKTIARAQQANPSQLLDVLKAYSPREVLSWLPRILATGGCPQNLLIASMRMYEVALPSVRAQASLEVAYKRVVHCLPERHPFHEITHIRQGLLRYLWGDHEGAQRSLRLALKSDQPKMREVTLYWLGLMEKNPKVKKIYWDSLMDKYPLTFHAIAAARESGRDLFTDFQKKPLLKPQRSAHDPIGQLAIRWLEALYMYRDSKSALNLSYRITKKFQSRFSHANLAYVAALGDKYNLPGDAMSLSSFIVRKVPGVLNPETLKFLYPKPFEKTFDRIAKRIDPLLTLSVAKQESGFNPYARSPANARGLLQILPSTAAAYEPRSQKYLYDIDTNLEVGGKILADLVNRLGRMEYALAAYNAGFNRVEDWKRRYDTANALLFIDLIPFTETRGYVANVLRNHYWYTSLYEPKKDAL